MCSLGGRGWRGKGGWVNSYPDAAGAEGLRPKMDSHNLDLLNHSSRLPFRAPSLQPSKHVGPLRCLNCLAQGDTEHFQVQSDGRLDNKRGPSQVSFATPFLLFMGSMNNSLKVTYFPKEILAGEILAPRALLPVRDRRLPA